MMERTFIACDCGGLIKIELAGMVTYSGPASSSFGTVFYGNIDGTFETIADMVANASTTTPGQSSTRGISWQKFVNLPRGPHSFFISASGSNAAWGLMPGTRFMVVEMS